MTNDPKNINPLEMLPQSDNDNRPGLPNPRPHAQVLTRRGFLALLLYLGGVGSGYLVWGRGAGLSPVKSSGQKTPQGVDIDALIQAVNPPDGFAIPARYGNVGPRALEAGAFNLNSFTSIFEQNGDPLSPQQIGLVTRGSQDPLVITSQNAHFLLNLFWASGLVNQNPILTNGPIQQYAQGKIDDFASTGGWTIGQKPVTDLFASANILQLNPEQQARVEEVAKGVYRPCCDNPTDFPDCNHGMAMLGLLELMASQNASVDAMFMAAKQINAFWFPQQTLEQAIYFKITQNQNFSNVDARTIVGKKYSSSSGFRQTHQWLADNNLLEQAPNSGNGCGA